MASYALLSSYSTVQVLSPTFVNPVVYCTIQTQPSNVVASIPVQKDVFDAGGGGPELTNLANAIEQIMAIPYVIAASGSQQLNAGGLLEDLVIFVVEYTPPGANATSITADAEVGVGMLNFTDGLIGTTLLAEVEAIIDGVYNNLKATATG